MAAVLLTRETVCEFVARLDLAELGDTSTGLSCEEITGGNLNFAWRVSVADSEPQRSVFVKQAPEFIKCLGEGYELTSRRIAYEVAALTELGRIAPALVPRQLHFCAEQCVAVMEDLRGLGLLRDSLLAGGVSQRVARELGGFVGAVHRDTAGREETFAAALGGDNNAAMCGITRDYVFTKPFVEDCTNRAFTAEFRALELRAHALRLDADFLRSASATRTRFSETREVFCHGDLHSGSVMTDGERCVAIDAEFAFFGPRGWDLGLLFAGYAFAYCSARAWAASANEAVTRRAKLKTALAAVWEGYETESHADAAALDAVLREALAMAGCELVRRVLGAASVPDLAGIAGAAHRQQAELFVVELGVALTKAPPASMALFIALLENTHDAADF